MSRWLLKLAAILIAQKAIQTDGLQACCGGGIRCGARTLAFATWRDRGEGGPVWKGPLPGNARNGNPRSVTTSVLRNLRFIDKKKKKAAMNPTLGPRYQYSQCDRLGVPIAVDVLFAHATGGYRPGPGRCAGWQRRHGTHMDSWRIRGASKRLRLRVQQSENSRNTILCICLAAKKQKPSRRYS